MWASRTAEENKKNDGNTGIGRHNSSKINAEEKRADSPQNLGKRHQERRQGGVGGGQRKERQRELKKKKCDITSGGRSKALGRKEPNPRA